MQIANLALTKTGATPIEYNIYAYEKYCNNTIGHNKWKCMAAVSDHDAAISEAQKLFSSEQFQKIEIKKKFYDNSHNRYRVTTCRVFEKQERKKNLLVYGFAAALSLCVMGVLLLEMM